MKHKTLESKIIFIFIIAVVILSNAGGVRLFGDGVRHPKRHQAENDMFVKAACGVSDTIALAPSCLRPLAAGEKNAAVLKKTPGELHRLTMDLRFHYAKVRRIIYEDGLLNEIREESFPDMEDPVAVLCRLCSGVSAIAQRSAGHPFGLAVYPASGDNITAILPFSTRFVTIDPAYYFAAPAGTYKIADAQLREKIKGVLAYKLSSIHKAAERISEITDYAVELSLLGVDPNTLTVIDEQRVEIGKTPLVMTTVEFNLGSMKFTHTHFSYFIPKRFADDLPEQGPDKKERLERDKFFKTKLIELMEGKKVVVLVKGARPSTDEEDISTIALYSILPLDKTTVVTDSRTESKKFAKSGRDRTGATLVNLKTGPVQELLVRLQYLAGTLQYGYVKVLELGFFKLVGTEASNTVAGRLEAELLRSVLRPLAAGERDVILSFGLRHGDPGSQLVSLWDSEEVRRMEKDLKEGDFDEKFTKVETKDVEKMDRRAYLLITKGDGFGGIYKHKDTGLYIIRRDTKHVVANINDVKSLCAVRYAACCPTFFRQNEKYRYYELNLAFSPFKYITLESYVRSHRGLLYPEVRDMIGRVVKEVFGPKQKWISHGHLHLRNILLKTDGAGVIQDVKIIDWKKVAYRDARRYINLELALRGGRPNLKGAILDDIYLEGAELKEIDFSQASLIHANMGWVDLRNAILDRIIGEGIGVGNSDLRGSSLIDAALVMSKMSNTLFNGAALINADLVFSIFNSVDFENANLKHAQCQRIELQGNCNFHGANLEEADFTDATFDSIDIFKEARLYKTIFSAQQAKEFSEAGYSVEVKHENGNYLVTSPGETLARGWSYPQPGHYAQPVQPTSEGIVTRIEESI